MCNHINHPTLTTKEVRQRIANMNELLLARAVTFESYKAKKNELLGYIAISHQPVIANQFIV